MYPQLTSLHWQGISRPIGSYGVMLTLALWVGSALVLREGRRAGLEEGALISSLATVVAAGFMGAVLCSVAVRWLQLGSLWQAMAAPGIVFYGALAAGGAGTWLAARVFDLPARDMLDVMIPGLPVGHALGRVGCLLGGCCYGAPSSLPWAVHYPGETLSRHPWPLYEAAGLCALALIFGRIKPPALLKAPGGRAMAYVVGYALLRLVLEPLRGDSVRGVFTALGVSLSTSQLISLTLLAIFAGFLCSPRCRPLRPTRSA